MSIKFSSKDKVLVLDFDHTCYDTDAFLLYEIRQPMLKRFDIPVPKWEESYEAAVKLGYSLGQHREELNKIIKSAPLSLAQMQALGKNINFNKYLYPDTMPVLKEAKAKGYKIMILSFGRVSWQNKKVLGAGLGRVVDLIEYVTADESNAKTESINKYAGQCRKVIFVDNNGRNLDAVHKMLPEVETYLINRVSSDAMDFGDDNELRVKYLESRKIAERQALPIHKRCHTLKEIIL